MDDWEDAIRGPCGIRYGVWIPRDPNYVKKQEQKTPEPLKTPANDWIKIKVVDDQTGRVVPGVMLDLKVPGGFIEPHETRRSGLVESLGLESGECEVSGDVNDLTLKNTLLFVGVGDTPIETPKEDAKPEGIPDPKPNNRYRIVNIEKHIVQKGDSFRKLANAAGIGRDALTKFNWPREGIYTPNEDLHTSDIIYIPKKWSQKGFETNRAYTIRVKREFFIEDDVTKKASVDVPLLKYTHDPSLKDGDGLRFKYEEGALKCSHVVGFDKRICDVPEDKRAAIKEHASFVYMDIGCWADNADGNQTKCRNFGLVCGPHVYLCRYTKEKRVPNSRLPSVQQFFREMLDQGCGIEVISYAYSGDETRRPKEDSDLYLFLGDLHLPPLTWLMRAPWRDKLGNLDIFGHAHVDLGTFLLGIRRLSPGMKKLLHFIQTGDMFEMWVGHPYLFKEGYNVPEWVDNDAPNEAVEWGRDVIDSNEPTFRSLREIWEGDFAEVRFLWGNHDDYLREPCVTVQLRQPDRYAYFTGQNGNIFCEHGHRFDQENFDNRPHDYFSILNRNFPMNFGTYYFPTLRSSESISRWIDGIGHPLERESYLLGAGLINLNLRVDQKKIPFTIYIMAHTHSCKLSRCVIKPKINEGG